MVDSNYLDSERTTGVLGQRHCCQSAVLQNFAREFDLMDSHKRKADGGNTSTDIVPAVKKARTDVVLYNQESDIVEMVRSSPYNCSIKFTGRGADR